MSLIVLATGSADLQARVERATDGNAVTLPLGPLPVSPAALFAQLEVDVLPDVIVLDSGLDPQPALELAANFDHHQDSTTPESDLLSEDSDFASADGWIKLDSSWRGL